MLDELDCPHGVYFVFCEEPECAPCVVHDTYGCKECNMRWDKLLILLEQVEDYMMTAPADDHRPHEATYFDGEEYCYGCAVGELSSQLQSAILDYIEARSHDG